MAATGCGIFTGIRIYFDRLGKKVRIVSLI